MPRGRARLTGRAAPADFRVADQRSEESDFALCRRDAEVERDHCGRAGALVTSNGGMPLTGSKLTDAISAALVKLYGEFYDHDRTTATTYINDNVVVCLLEDILSAKESRQIADGDSGDVIDGRVAFQEGEEDEFTATIERLTQRKVTAFLSANQTAPGVACELFFLEPPPVAVA